MRGPWRGPGGGLRVGLPWSGTGGAVRLEVPGEPGAGAAAFLRSAADEGQGAAVRYAARRDTGRPRRGPCCGAPVRLIWTLWPCALKVACRDMGAL
ncbi:hypothetical protein NDU88_006649 [Pleurodeles waltl]|uniref:Uncharacterized protein n=1 Tax=Pleurodeles waltl TaxID=8319 RepID=A0AAV7SQH1_PLEWA|nr:hypothetical protein NDU88_006649 [Pleurodeles waltl]